MSDLQNEREIGLVLDGGEREKNGGCSRTDFSGDFILSRYFGVSLGEEVRSSVFLSSLSLSLFSSIFFDFSFSFFICLSFAIFGDISRTANGSQVTRKEYPLGNHILTRVPSKDRLKFEIFFYK